MTSVTAVQGTWATLSVNIGDFSRYCKSPRSNWIQLFAFPLINTLVSIFAAISATCAYAVYNEELYQPYDILAKWDTSPGGRAAMFLGALTWALSNVTTNITANSISAANDLCSLAPKYINIRRGQFIAITLGVWGFVPWKVLNSAANFLTFMASYSIVLAPIAFIMVIDFYFVKGRKLDIYELYRPRGIYRFNKGWNWRAYVALAVAVAPNLPGMIHAISPTTYIGNIKYLYMVSNIVAYFSEPHVSGLADIQSSLSCTSPSTSSGLRTARSLTSLFTMSSPAVATRTASRTASTAPRAPTASIATRRGVCPARRSATLSPRRRAAFSRAH